MPIDQKPADETTHSTKWVDITTNNRPLHQQQQHPNHGQESAQQRLQREQAQQQDWQL